jgi:hypothetical protein
MNYTQLKAAIIAYTNNQDLAFEAEVPLFVKQAEQRIFNMVQFPSLRKNVTGSTSSANKYLACPSDFLSAHSMAVVDNTTGAYEYLLNKDVNFIRQAYPTPSSVGFPKYYALFGPRSDDVNELTFILGPTPNAAYVVELHYFYYPPSIVDAGTSWLGDNFDSVLLYGSLVEAYTYMKGEMDIMQGYDMKFKEAVALAKRLGDGLERSDSYRSGQFRLPPLPQNRGVT